MTTFLTTLTLLSILFFLGISAVAFSGHQNRSRPSLAGGYFVVWLVASALFSGYFYILPIPFFFDISIERLFFFGIMLAAGIGLITGLQERRFANYTLEMLMVVFVLLCLFSMYNHGFFQKYPQFPSPWFTFITAYLFPFFVFFFAKLYLANEADIKLIFHVLFFFGLYLVILSFFEWFRLHQFVFPRFITNPEIGTHFGWARGPFLNSPYMGAALLYSLACGIHLYFTKQNATGFVYLPLLLSFLPPLFFTQTRAVWLSLVILMATLFFIYRTAVAKWRAFALPILIAILLVMAAMPSLLTTRDRSVGGLAQTETVDIRKGLFQLSTMMIRDHPFFGVGLAQFLPATIEEYKGKVTILNRYEGATYNHNHLIGMLTELGLTGFTIYILILLTMFRKLRHLTKYLPDQNTFLNKNFVKVVGVMWLAYLVNFNFASPEYHVFPNAVFFLLAGLVDGLLQQSEDKKHSELGAA